MTMTLETLAERIEKTLKDHLPTEQNTLCEAMRYSVLNGGKRLRPLLVYATASDCNIPLEHCDAAAVAVEYIHCYSLIHDDLPSMDNDALRRGKPTCHIVFGDAVAILAGDALQSLAIEILSHNPYLPPASTIAMIKTLTAACGMHGMVAGQAQDILQLPHSLQSLETMHRLKTGALIRACCELPLYADQHLDTHTRNHLCHFARDIGLAFQIQDDVLDIESPTVILGKPQGSDCQANKITYPSLIGLEAAKRMAKELLAQALHHLARTSLAFPLLTALAHRMIERDH